MSHRDRLRVRGRMLLLLGLLLTLALPGVAVAQAPVFPEVIQLPVGFAPEGIAVGRGTSFYTGSLADGSVYGGDLRTGEGAIVVPPQPGRISVGMKVDPRTNYLFVAGGTGGVAYVYDAQTGAEVAVLPLALPGASFINDVVVTREAAYFTNSSSPYFYRLPLGPGGRVANPAAADTVMLTGEWVQVAGFNANGITATPDGRWLIIVNSTTGKLYRVDPANGGADEIDLGGAGDDQRRWDSVARQDAVCRAEPPEPDRGDLARARFSRRAAWIGTSRTLNFAVPTTIAEHGQSLYAVNAKFGTPAPGTPYEVVKVSR